MSKNPYDYKTLRWRWIYLNMLLTWVVTVVMVLLSPYAAIFFALFAVGSGWQMGVLSERNEWQEWYKAAEIHMHGEVPSERLAVPRASQESQAKEEG